MSPFAAVIIAGVCGFAFIITLVFALARSCQLGDEEGEQ